MPDDVLSADLKDVLKVIIGVVGTLSALLLIPLINSARSSYDQQHTPMDRQRLRIGAGKEVPSPRRKGRVPGPRICVLQGGETQWSPGPAPLL